MNNRYEWLNCACEFLFSKNKRKYRYENDNLKDSVIGDQVFGY